MDMKEYFTTTEHVWTVRPRINLFHFLVGLTSIGFLLSAFPKTNALFMGYIVAGVVLIISFKWEYGKG